MADFTNLGFSMQELVVGDVFGKGTPWVSYITLTGVQKVKTSFFDVYFFNYSGDSQGETSLVNEASTKALSLSTTAISGVAGLVTYNSNPLSGVSICTGEQTNAEGQYYTNNTLLEVPTTVTPSKGGYTFTPSSRDYTGLTGFRSDEDYVGSLGTVPLKATNPNPAHEATGVDFSNRTLSWVNGGGATSYDVYMGDASDNLTKVSSSQAGTSYVATEANIALFTGGLCYWRVDAINIIGTTTGDVWNFDARPVKPINPAPETEEVGVNRKTENITWEDGGGATTFNVHFGTVSGNLTEVMTDVPVILPELLAPYVVLEIKDYDPFELSGYRSPKVGDELTDGTTTYTLWAVQRGDRVNTQYEAKLYAFRIGPPCSAGTVLTNGVAPDINDPQAVSVTLNDSLFFSGEVESALYPWATRYYWRVDAVNEAGTTTGDEWYFDVQRSYKEERMNYYDPDLNWGYTDGQYKWSEVYVAGGGRYQQQFVAVGHNCIYFGSI